MTLTEQTDVHPENFYLLTGRVIREWAKLELLLSRWLIALLTVDELRARIIWDSYGDFRGKTNLLKTLTRNFADEGLWPQAKEILAEVERIAGNRYILPHAFGEVDQQESRLSFFSEKFDDSYVVNFVEERSVDISTLQSWINDLAICQRRVVDLGQRLSGCVHQASLMQRRQTPSQQTSGLT